MFVTWQAAVLFRSTDKQDNIDNLEPSAVDIDGNNHQLQPGVPTIPWLSCRENTDHEIGQKIRGKMNEMSKRLEKAINNFKLSGQGDKGQRREACALSIRMNEFI